LGCPRSITATAERFRLVRLWWSLLRPQEAVLLARLQRQLATSSILSTARTQTTLLSRRARRQAQVFSCLLLKMAQFQDGTQLASTCPLPNQCFAPFGIQNIGGNLYVSFALQDAEHHDDAHGPSRGFVDVFDTNGNLIKRLISRGALNSPWGLALAPANFGQF